MDKINLLVKTLLIAALLVPIVAVTVISNSNSIANASTNTTETPSSLLLSNSSLPSASLVNETLLPLIIIRLYMQVQLYNLRVF